MIKSVAALLSGVLVLSTILPGCDRQERMDHSVAPVEKQQHDPDAGTEERSDSEAGISLALIPESPTAKEDIEVVLRGTSGAEDIAWHVNGAAVSEVTGRILPRRYFSRGDQVAVTVVSNGKEVSVATLVGNSPPEMVSVATSRPPIHRGTAIEVIPEAVDVDGDDVDFRFVWAINGDALHWEEGASLAGDKFFKGDIVHLTVVPFDGESEGQPSRRLEFRVEDAPPVFVSSPPETFQSFEFIYPSRAVDPDGEEVEYALVEGPEGMIIDGITGEVRWSIPADGHEENKVRIVARNTAGVEAFQDFSLKIQKRIMDSE